MKGYLYLTASIMAEVLSTTMLKFSDGFTRFFPSCGAILGYLLTFYSLSLCLNFIPLSIAYAVWSGVGTALTVLIGIMIWGEVLNMIKIIGITFIVGGVIILNFSENVQD